MAEQILTQGASAGNLLVSNGRSNPSDAGKAVAKAAGTNPQPAAQALVAAASIDTVTTSNVLVGAAKSVPFAAGKAVVEATRIPGPPSNELLTADMVLESGKADAGATARMLAFSGGMDSGLTGVFVVFVSDFNAKLAGLLVAKKAASTNPDAIGQTLVEAARVDPDAMGPVLAEAAMTDAAATSRAVLAAARTDSRAINAALALSIGAYPGALPVLGTGIVVDSFLTENPPRAGIDPTTGEIWQIVGSGATIERILAKFSREIPNARVDLTEVAELPPGVASLPLDQAISEYVRLTPQNFREADLRGVHITFLVEKSWLEANDIHPWAVCFNRYHEERRTWVAYTAKRIREDDQRVYYAVQSSGFSLWAISGSYRVPPIQFRVDDLIIDPVEIRENERVTIQVKVTN